LSPFSTKYQGSGSVRPTLATCATSWLSQVAAAMQFPSNLSPLFRKEQRLLPDNRILQNRLPGSVAGIAA